MPWLIHDALELVITLRPKSKHLYLPTYIQTSVLPQYNVTIADSLPVLETSQKRDLCFLGITVFIHHITTYMHPFIVGTYD